MVGYCSDKVVVRSETENAPLRVCEHNDSVQCRDFASTENYQPTVRAGRGVRIAVATYASASAAPDAGRVIFLENFADELQRKLPLQGN
jgi:hypothetical protein